MMKTHPCLKDIKHRDQIVPSVHREQDRKRQGTPAMKARSMQQQGIARGYGDPLRLRRRGGTLVTAVVTPKPKPFTSLYHLQTFLNPGLLNHGLLISGVPPKKVIM